MNKIIVNILKILLTWTLATIIFILTSSIFTLSAVNHEKQHALLPILIYSFFMTGILVLLIRSSVKKGWVLAALLFTGFFGVQTVMTQSESVFFIKALPFTLTDIIKIVLTNAAYLALIIPLSVLIWEKRETRETDEKRTRLTSGEIFLKSTILSVFYVLLYFACGQYIAYGFRETRDFYAGLPAGPGVPVLVGFQIVRGYLWTLFLMPVVIVLKKRTVPNVILTAVLAAFGVTMLLIFPNPAMPPAVRFSHFLEINTSNLIFGALCALLFLKNKKRDARDRSSFSL